MYLIEKHLFTNFLFQYLYHNHKTKKMKKIIIIAIVLIGGLCAFGINNYTSSDKGHRHHGKKNPVEMAKHHTERMVEMLKLNEEQAKKVEAINLATAEKMKEIHHCKPESKEEMKKQIHSLMEQHTKDMKPVLTKEQFVKFKEMKAKHMAHMHSCHKGEDCHHGGHAQFKAKIFPEILKARKEFDSKLTEAEKTTISEHRVKLKALKEECNKNNKSDRNKSCDHSKCDHKGHEGKMSEMIKKNAQPIIDIANNHKSDLEEIHNELTSKYPEMKRKHDHMIQNEDAKIMMAVRFLMMDPNKETIAESREIEAKVYPNPASEELSIEYVNKTEGNVFIQLIDNKGQAIKTIKKGYLKAGTYTEVINVTDVKNDYVLATVITSAGQKQIKVIISKK